MKVYLVGGAVRDGLLNLPINEKDWVVVGSTIKEMIKKGYIMVGKNFPVFLHPVTKEEYALARKEKKIGKRHKDFIFNFSPNTTLKEDLLRRDLTINAIAKDKKGSIIDPYNGLNDIKNKLIRHVSESFYEDPLRILRTARLAAKLYRFNFKVYWKTLIMMKNMSNDLKFISKERIWRETEKALKNENPQIYFKILRVCDALKVIFREINLIFGIPSINRKKKIFDTGKYSLFLLSKISKISKNPIIRFSSLCHDIGKIKTIKKEWPLHKKHEILGIKIINIFFKSSNIPNNFINTSILVSKYHEILYKFNNFSPKNILEFFNIINIWKDKKNFEIILKISSIDAILKFNSIKKIKKNIKKLFYMYKMLKKIKPQDVIKDGFLGLNIKKEINKRRLILIKTNFF
ncbi:MAG: multifunctional CCA tRNA nucleotidyl transferase/2'3'-cyclic phosphodiesterase/2'nucleotidase/phosphatase [Enterobacteriaceae bacterium]